MYPNIIFFLKDGGMLLSLKEPFLGMGNKLRNKLKIFLLFLILTQTTIVKATTNPHEIMVSIQSDGVTSLDYQFQAEITSLETNITLIGKSYQDLFIINEDGLPLDFEEFSEYITVFSLGSNLINVSYVTAELTSKTNVIWSLNITIPISSKIVLPNDSTIINLNVFPLEIKTDNEKTILIMPAGNVVVEYILDILDSKSIAEEAIHNAEEKVQSAKNKGVIVTEAEILLGEARDLFNQEKYLEAEEKATQTNNLVDEIVEKKALADAKISATEIAVNVAQESGKTIGLDEAQGLLLEAKNLYSKGNYDQALIYAEQALETALNAEKSPNYTIYIVAGVLITLAVGVFLFLRGRETSKQEPLDVIIDLESLFEEHPELRLDDREVLKYLAENDGEAFAYDIRERFDIPRTSAWRMIQRLQRYEIVDERKIGGQSLIQIKEKYRRKGKK
jgi:uncharacterized membrane protein